MNPFATIASKEKLWGIWQKDASILRANPRRVAADIMRIFLAVKVVIVLWGPPGARKTRYTEAINLETDWNGVPFQVITMQPSTSDPTVMHGMYYTSQEPDGTTVMLRSIPDVAQQVMNYHEKCGGYTVILVDEVTTCSKAQQNAMLGLFTHGKYGDLDIQPYTAFVMAANPEGTVSSVNELSEAVINRGGHIAWYGDPELFLEEWSTGFNNPDNAPDELTEWYIRSLIEGSMETAFRDPDRWSIDDLVPYDLFTHSERSTTDLARIIAYINDEFSDAPNDIRHHYIIKATEAMQGPKWANRMAEVCKRESSVVTHTKLKNMVKSANISSQTSLFDLQSALGVDMFKSEGVNGVTSIPDSTVVELSEKLLDEFMSSNDMLSYLTIWAFVTTSPDSGRAALINPICLEALNKCAQMSKDGEIDKIHVMPEFVQPETKMAIKSLKESISH